MIAARVVRHAEVVMGTVVSFAFHADPTVPWRAALAAACADLKWVDETFSPWREESAVSRLRRNELSAPSLPAELDAILDLCRLARDWTGGWFDPWSMPGGVDPTGLVKGWAVERAATCLSRAGVEAGIVNGGGDIATFGRYGPTERWRVGIRHPWRADALAAIVEADGAVATSGAYERGQHLIDPHTGSPGSAVASATVTGPSLAMADAFATGLAVAGTPLLPRIERRRGYEAYLIGWDGVETSTPGFPLASEPVVTSRMAGRR
jgi:thiamine biosynthesis lipoprotein